LVYALDTGGWSNEDFIRISYWTDQLI